MRVGVVGPLTADSLATNLLDCLSGMGFEAVPLHGFGPPNPRTSVRYGMEALRRFGAEGEFLTQKPLVKRVSQGRCDVVINTMQSLLPEVVAGMKETGARVCSWFPDAVSNLGRLSLISGRYDALFFKDPLLVERLVHVYGMNAHYLPEACNPSWHRPVGNAQSEPFIVAVGNLYATRARLLVRLHQDGVPLRLYGGNDGNTLKMMGGAFPRGFAFDELRGLHAGQAVFRVDKSKVFREARGVLNNLHPAEMQSVNCRLFEATAAGAAVLCERRTALSDLFEEGNEVLGFDSYDELLGHCQSLLADPALGTRIGNAASVRSLRDHSYEQRVNVMLAILC